MVAGVQTGDLTLVREVNKGIVLNLLRTLSPLSRSDISRITGLNKATVSSLTADLVAGGRVLELGAGPSQSGRKPQMLSLNARAGLVLGVQLDARYVRGLCCDLLGQPLLTEQVDLPPGTGPREGFETLVNLVRALVNLAPAAPMGLLGAAVGIPGVVDRTGAVIAFVDPDSSWKEIPLRARLEDALSIPMVIENAANAAAMGEWCFGAANRVRDLVYVHLSMGMGAGVILDGRLYRGSHGAAGEIGHMTLEATGPHCRCGNRGCWQLYAAEQGIRRMLPRHDHLGLDQLIQLAADGDADVAAALLRAGEALGKGLVGIINAFDPEMVVIGGPLAAAHRFLLPAAAKALAVCRMPGRDRAVPVVTGTLGRDACALGAAAILLDKHFSLPSLQLPWSCSQLRP